PAAKPAAKPVKSSTATPAAASWRNLAIVVLVLTAACYLPSLRNGFVNWDDPKNITENENLLLVGRGQPWGLTISNIFDLEKGNVIGNYNPLPILTFAIEKSLAGGEFSPTLTHTVNLLLHLLTVLMVMKVLWGMGIGRWGVALGGLLFGIHPMRVESVAWATERKDVLFAVFFFAALSYYIQWLKKGEKGESRTNTYLIMLVMALLSCFSKVQAVTLPLSMLALDYWFRRPLNFKLILEKTPFWALSLIFGLINIYTLRVQGSTEDTLTNYNFIDRLCVGAYSFCTYLYKAVIPWPMSPLYAYPKQLPITVYLAPLGFLAAAAGVWWAWKKGLRTWVFGAAFFFFNVMFLLQVFAAGQGFLADRFTYVAYFGLFAIAAYYADLYYNKENGAGKIYTALGIIAVVYGAWTVKQIGIWKDGGTLWTHVMSLDEGESERSSLPYWNRGQFLRNERGDYDGALKDYTRAVEMDPTNPELLNSRGKTYFDMAASGKFKNQEKTLIEKAIKDYTEALSKPKITNKSKSEALSNRGAAYGLSGMFEQSILDISESIALDPNNKNAYSNRSIAYLNTGQYEKALADYQSYLKFDPNNPSFWYESGMVQRVIKRNEDAVKSLDRAIQLKPGLSIAWRERARAKAQAGDKAGAQADYQRAAQLGSPMEAFDQQLMGN
ncbi:MAG: tetratricopeptide repeat protein, partial [Saprospiraceae bacterium]|nr:tetratricopeptide repeat protein [Saprospiraceae bacterium]